MKPRTPIGDTGLHNDSYSSLGEEAVQGAAGVGEHSARLLDLLLVPRLRDLHGGGGELPEEAAKVAASRAGLVSESGPGLPERLAMLLDVGATRLREDEALAALVRVGLDEALVLELGERGVDRAGARPPDALAAALDLLHEAVAVARLLVEQHEQGGSDVAAPHPASGPERPASTAMVPPRPAAARGHGVQVAPLGSPARRVAGRLDGWECVSELHAVLLST